MMLTAAPGLQASLPPQICVVRGSDGRLLADGGQVGCEGRAPNLSTDADAGDGPDIAQLCRPDGAWTRRTEMSAVRNESDGGSDGDGEAMHRGNMQGEVEVPGQ